MADTRTLNAIHLKTHPNGFFGKADLAEDHSNSADSVMCGFQCPEATSLTGATIYCLGVTGTAPNYKLQLEGIDPDNGDPDGSVKAVTAEFQPSATTVEAHAFTTPYTCTQGEPLCIRTVYSSGTIDGSNSANFVYGVDGARYTVFPYQQRYNGSSWYGSYDDYPSMTVQTGLTNIDFGGIFSINSGSSIYREDLGDRVAQRMYLSDADGDLEVHLKGFNFKGKVERNTYGEFKVGVWSAAGATLNETDIDSGQQQRAMTATIPYGRDYIFDSDVTILSGQVYYIGFEISIAGYTNALDVSYEQPLGAAGLKSWPGGQAFYASTYDDSSSTWTDDLTKRFLLDPIVSSFHGVAGEGGGGSSIPAPSMGVIG